MITCPVCRENNQHLAVTCASCGSYVQRRVDNIDLFSTIWKIIETPGKAFHEIAIAVHKNYVFVISLVTGFWEAFMLFRLIDAGETTPQILNIMVAGVVVAPFLGIAVTLLIAGSTAVFLRVYREKARFRNILAVSAYVQIPVMFMSVILVPLELMTWGIYFFTKTPAAWELYPSSYYIVMGFTGVGLAWTFGLFLVGLKRLLDTRWQKTLAVALSVAIVLTVAVMLAVQFLRHI